MGFDNEIDYISHRSALCNGFDKEIDYISHRNALPWVLIRILINFLIVVPCAMVLIRELILFLIVMPCDGF